MPYIGTSPSNSVRRVHTYTATASQTTFTGASSEGVTLSYADTNYIDVFQNGVLLGSADYTSTSGTSVVLAQGASADDLIVIVVYDVFSVADTVSKTNGGTFDGAVTFSQTPVGSFISVADQWRLTGSTNEGSNADVTGTWERVDNTGWSGIGTGLTDSSGVFSFASTGIYLIIYTAEMFTTSGDGSGSLTLDITVNNSSFATASITSCGNSGGGATTNQSGTNFFLFDVQDTSNYKFKFATTSMSTNTKLNGNTSYSRTGFSVIRLGGT